MFISDSWKYACASLPLTPQLPRGLFTEPPLDSGGADDEDRPNRRANSEIEHHIFTYTRVPTSTGKPGKPGKSQKKVPCMEKSWNLKKTEKSWKNHGIL